MFTLLEHPDAHTKDVTADIRADMATVATRHNWQQSHCTHSPTPPSWLASNLINSSAKSSLRLKWLTTPRSTSP